MLVGHGEASFRDRAVGETREEPVRFSASLQLKATWEVVSCALAALRDAGVVGPRRRTYAPGPELVKLA